MRLGILGPAQGDLPALARAAQRLLDEAHADKVLYISDDDALDQVVAGWARGLVGADPSEASLFARASRCAEAGSEAIDAFVVSESARLRLRVLASLPPGQRTIEILDGRVVLFVFDKATLDEEDILPASVLVVGKSPTPFIRKAGARTFLAPGPIGSQDGGAALLDDGGGGMRIEVMNLRGAVTAREVVGAPHQSAKMRVQGG
ncbi:hypothetical protein [Chondromyces crocatus]|uniref:Uncharacterized protein n=1 Tax=Chondromyces crocatus TaxID=52 RepID=A0A0K1EG00_CHOCO|nr:hypothetical protein [Chondromyces crocatus]AKT39774.1 uncharacterized protein CMC5_039250 [Chondromyces crocatus]